MENNKFNSFQQQREVIDLRDVWYTWRKNVGFVARVTAGCLAVAVIALVVIKPTYESKSLIRIKPQKGLSGSVLDLTATGMTNPQVLNTYLSILQSDAVVVPVSAEFESFGKKVNAMPVAKSDLIQISATSKDPEEARKINQKILTTFLDCLTDLERQQFTITRQFLEGRVEEAKKDLFKAEDTLAKFQQEHKIVSSETAASLVANKLAMTDKLKAENRINMEAAQAMANAVSGQMQENAAVIADSPVVASLNAQLAELENKRIQLDVKYKPKHPAMIKINEDIAAVKAKLDEEISKVAANQAPAGQGIYSGLLREKIKSQAEANVAASNLRNLDKIEEEFQGDINTLTEDGKEHLRLMRDVNVAGEIYTMLAKRLEEAKVAEVSISREVQIVVNAGEPEKVSPKPVRTLGLGFLLGLLGSSALVIGRMLMDRTYKTADDVTKYLDIPVLGQIPSMESLNEAKEVAQLSTWQKIWRALCKK